MFNEDIDLLTVSRLLKAAQLSPLSQQHAFLTNFTSFNI